MKKSAYQQSILANDTLYTSGQLAIGSQGELVGENDIHAQTIQALKNLERVLAEKGFGLENITSMMIFLQDIDRDFNGMDDAYREFFQSRKPSRATVEAKLFKSEFLIEIVSVAAKVADNRVEE